MSIQVESIGKYISILNRHCQAYISKHLKEYNIGSGQYIFLVALYNNNGIGQDKLADMLNIDKGTAAKALKKLEEAGYVIRTIDEDDRRAYRLYTTDKALEIKHRIFEVLHNTSGILSLDFTAEEKELARKMLEKMSLNAISHLK